MKVFDPDSFFSVATTAVQAHDIASVADNVLRTASFVLYGKYVGGKYIGFSSIQKPEDTHVIFAFAPKRMAPPKK